MLLTSGANLSNVIKLNKKVTEGMDGARVKEMDILCAEICLHRCRLRYHGVQYFGLKVLCA